MKALKELSGVAAPLPMINVDTDMIIPKQYLKTIERTGLGKGLFHSMRYNDDGSDNPDFVLNKEAYRDSKILIAGDNFGCGSSREHAAWAIDDFGIRCVIAPSFSDIFYNNAFKNGMLALPSTWTGRAAPACSGVIIEPRLKATTDKASKGFFIVNSFKQYEV